MWKQLFCELVELSAALGANYVASCWSSACERLYCKLVELCPTVKAIYVTSWRRTVRLWSRLYYWSPVNLVCGTHGCVLFVGSGDLVFS